MSEPITKDDLDSALTGIRAEVASTHDKVIGLEKDLKEVKKNVSGDGNGNPGFGEKIRDNQSEIRAQEVRLKAVEEATKQIPLIIDGLNMLKKMAWAVISTVGLGVIMWVIYEALHRLFVMP